VTAWNGNWLLGLEVEVLRAVAWLGFFAVSLGRWYRFSERELKIARGASFVLVPVLFPGSLMLFILLGEQTAFILACAAMILCNALALVLIENIFFNTRSDAGFGWKVVGGGACVIALFDLYMYSSLIFSDHVDFRIIISRSYIYAFVGLLLAFVSVSGWGLGRKFSLSRSAAFHSTALIGAGAYILLTSVGGELLRFRNNNWGPALELVFLAVALVVLTTTMTSAALRARMMVFISKHFFRLKYDYREVWVEFIRKMASPEERESLHERTLRALGNAIGCRNGMLWIFQSAIESYTAMAHWHVAENNDLISSEQGLPQFLLRTGWIVDIEQCLYDPDFYNGIVLPDGMSKQKDGWIIVPLIHRRVLEGFAVLGDPASRPNRLSWEDFDLLKMVGAQAASYLAEDRASRELVDALRVAEFNRRFSFMVHDIKNVVSQMAMMLQNAEKFGGDPEFQKDMLVTVGSSVDRLQRMLVSLGSQNGAKRPDVKPVELVELVHAAAQRWKHSYPRLMHRCDSGNMTVMASTERLDSVLDHLVQNAIEAARTAGSRWFWGRRKTKP